MVFSGTRSVFSYLRKNTFAIAVNVELYLLVYNKKPCHQNVLDSKFTAKRMSCPHFNINTMPCQKIKIENLCMSILSKTS